MATCNASTILAQACANGFNCETIPEQLVLLNQLLCNLSAAGGSTPNLILDNIALNVQVPLQTAHGLGSTPRMMRFVVKITNAAGITYAVGDENEGSQLFNPSTFLPPLSWGANATNVWIVSDNTFAAGDCRLIQKTGGGSFDPIDFSNAVGKLYIWT